MRLSVLVVLICGSAAAQGYPPPAPPAAAGLTVEEALAAVQDAGTLNHAARDTYANTFIASGLAPDGGTAAYSFISARDTKWKLGAGSLNELRPVGNTLYLDNGETVTTTLRIAQPACLAGSSCRWYSDLWFGFFPGSIPACSAGTEGGLKPDSTTHDLIYCNGTRVNRIAFTVPWTSSLNFGAISAGECANLTFVATGGVKGEAVACGGLSDLEDADSSLFGSCSISATDTGRVHACCNNLLSACANPAAIQFTITAVR